MGGEKFCFGLFIFCQPGSPPRGRGKGSLSRLFPIRTGITPAWAGKRALQLTQEGVGEDHPRVGGEKDRSRIKSEPGTGSPPRGRGKGCHSDDCRCTHGITPAWAGKRFPFSSFPHTYWDHPRVGGEKLHSSQFRPECRGSPPRGRGKVILHPIHCPHGRITPAWAGKRLKRSHRSGIFISGPIPFHSVLHRPAGSGGSRAGRDGSPAGQPQNTGPA